MKKLTILVPFKNREENLSVFVPYMVNFMKRNHPNIIYDIVVIEQGNDKPFNKGILFNAGFLLTSGNTDYYSLHDVDQLPISSNYEYNDKPYHMCINTFEQSDTCKLINTYENDGYKQRGGMIIINNKNYISANGHSNNYWGWGLIDDDFSIRLNHCNISLWRKHNHKELCYYVSLKANTKRFYDDEYYKRNYDYCVKFKDGVVSYLSEGLNTTVFTIKDKIEYPNYIKYKIDFDNEVIY